MVTMDSLEAQLKKVDFKSNGWGRSEARELVNILHDHEEIYDLVNGFYDGGFALLVATNLRLILVDKKPLNYLTVEDVRYDMINEISYSHRLVGAHVNVATGNNKKMQFTSLNQQRLRKTIGHVQHCMAESKKSQNEHASSQKDHLAQINQQLQAYLLAQHQQQQALKEQLDAVRQGDKAPEEVKIEPVKPSHELSDYLFAQSLLANAKKEHPDLNLPEPNSLATEILKTTPITEIKAPYSEETATQIDDLYEEGMKEVYGKRETEKPVVQSVSSYGLLDEKEKTKRAKKYGKMMFFPLPGGVEIQPFRVAYKTTARALKKRRKEVEAKSETSSNFDPEKKQEPSPMNHRIFHMPV